MDLDKFILLSNFSLAKQSKQIKPRSALKKKNVAFGYRRCACEGSVFGQIRLITQTSFRRRGLICIGRLGDSHVISVALLFGSVGGDVE